MTNEGNSMNTPEAVNAGEYAKMIAKRNSKGKEVLPSRAERVAKIAMEMFQGDEVRADEFLRGAEANETYHRSRLGNDF